MTNLEKYQNELIELAISGDAVAVHLNTHKVVACDSIRCEQCMFNNSCATLGREKAVREWFAQEYVEIEAEEYENNQCVWYKRTPDDIWRRGHYSHKDGDTHYVYTLGQSSWTAHFNHNTMPVFDIMAEGRLNNEMD